MANLARVDTDEIELDIQFGQEPLGLAHIVQDKAMIVTGTLVLTWLGWISGGPLLGLLAAYVGANDLKFSRPKSDQKPWFSVEDEPEDEIAETVDTTATEVIEPETVAQKLDCLGNPVVKVEAQVWPPVVETQPATVGFKRAKDVVAECHSPKDLLSLMGDDAPDWLKLQVAQDTFEYPEPYPEERLDGPGPVAAYVPESLFEPMVRAVHEPVQDNGSGSGSVQQFNGSDFEIGLQKAVQNGPYVVPVVGSKGRCYSFVRTAIALEKSQTWISENLFGAKKGGSKTYQNAVEYIKWVQKQ